MHRFNPFCNDELGGAPLSTNYGRKINGTPVTPVTGFYRKNLLFAAPLDGDIIIINHHPALPKTPTTGNTGPITIEDAYPKLFRRKRLAAEAARNG